MHGVTAPPDPNAAFAAAERAYVDGRFTDAREHLSATAGLGHPAAYHLLAVVEQALGDLPAARAQFEAALRLRPSDPGIWNDFGTLLRCAGDSLGALGAYDRALEISPRFTEAMFNRALLLVQFGRRAEARDAFRALIHLQPTLARSWNGIALLEREDGDLAAAASAYDRALALAPGDKLAMVGRARIALERAEPDSVERYRAARRLAPENLELAIDEAEARLGAGDRTALAEFATIARAAPDWTHGQIALARMRWEQGERSGSADHIEALLKVQPANASLWRDYIELLARCGEPARAADAAERARHSVADPTPFALVEAIQSGKAGQVERAEALFEKLSPEVEGRNIHEGVHRIRRGDLERALVLVEAALGEDRWDYAAWGIAEILYRKTGDDRAHWLSDQPGLVGVSSLDLDSADFQAVDTLLKQLHRNAVETVGQSVHGGTQTRWQLFDRMEPEIARLRLAVEQAVSRHMAGLPAFDPTHPLLRHNGRQMKIAASWSVRFLDAGYHVPHYHPKGLISSACYFRVPPHGALPQEGWLEIGRPPADFLMDLEPLQTIEPKPGQLVLFPSYLFHGTRPFSAGERVSVAFDATAAESST